MKKVGTRIKGFWRKLAFWTQITLVTLIVLVVAARIALPYVVRDYVNRRLNKIPEYSGHVQKIRINLYRGAYTIENLNIVKTNSSVPVPFISMREMDLSVQWKELFHGSVVGKVRAVRPRVNFVNGPTEKEQQTGAHKDWQKVLADLFPFKINRFDVYQGDIRFRDFSREPKVDLYVTNLMATATNLNNTREVGTNLPAGLIAQGKSIGMGDLRMELHMNPLAETPTFKLSAGISNVDLVALNNFMRAYGKFDVAAGTFEIYSEIAAANGRYQGYVKPLFEHLEVFDWDKERKKNILQIFWQAIVAGVGEIFRNQPHDRLATKIPISGNFEKSKVDLWATIGGILKNAFVRALVPKVDRSVDLPDAPQKQEKEKPSKPKPPPSPTGAPKNPHPQKP